MSNVVQFPKRPGQSIGVRVVPSERCLGVFEVQVFEDGRWRAKAAAQSQERAKDISAKFVADRLFPIDDDSEFPA